MTGYIVAHGSCARCGAFFSFNPQTVPSVGLPGARRPICYPCMVIINREREKLGQPVITIPEDAYTFEEIG